MTTEQFKRTPLQFEAGPLGHLEGVSLLGRDGAQVLKYFGGLPYALPPVGPYRFRKPRRLPDHFRYGSNVNPGRHTQTTAFCPQPGANGGIRDVLLDEDCLQLNIYVPPGSPPPAGWPVFFNIHGGFLQWGDANWSPEVIAPLMRETPWNAIVVMPAYRLNIFGFLASNELGAEARRNGEPVGNMGFWDQRLALEWTAANISHFSGDPKNITVGGYSAGAHSTFQQLAHELYYVPPEKALIKRAIMWSNSPGLQPKSLPELQHQFDEVLANLGIPQSLSADEKLARLRSAPSQDLIMVQDKLRYSQFRGVSDGTFISKSLISNINSGDLARRMKARRIKLMIGECRDEHDLYQAWRTPAQSFQAVYDRLCADYPESAVAKLCELHCGKRQQLPADCRDWQHLFGKLYANMQVHSLQRGFHNALQLGGLQFGQDVFRYRFDWQSQASKDALPADWGVTHTTDLSVWIWGYFGSGLTPAEKDISRELNAAFCAFVHGDPVLWGTQGAKQVKRLNADGVTDIWDDNEWDEGVNLWNSLNGTPGASLLSWIKSKL